MEQHWRDLDEEGEGDGHHRLPELGDWQQQGCERSKKTSVRVVSGERDGMVLSTNVATFSGILRGRTISMVFYGNRHLLMLHDQFSLNITGGC